MKVAAHPLVVAVALGLLAPQALEAAAPEQPPTCHDDDDSVADDAGTTTVVWEPGEAPSPEEIHRVELEWLKVTG